MNRASGQQGLALIELVLAMALTLLVAVWGMSALVDSHRRQAARADAVWMLELRGAILAFLEKYRIDLEQAYDTNALSAQGYPAWPTPTIGQLRDDGLLPAYFPETSPGGGAVVRVLRHDGCPSLNCGVYAIIHSAKPYLHESSAQVDEARVAEWLMATQGHGGHVPLANPTRMKGPAFDYPNPAWPAQALPAGTVALSVQVSQEQIAYLRMRDQRDPDFQGALTVAQTLTAKQGLTVDGLIKLNATVTAGSLCSDTGALARTATGELLTCRDSRWKQTGPRRLGAFSINSLYGCFNSTGGSTANPVTHECGCPVGAAMTEVSDSGPQPFPYGRVVGFVCVD